MIPNFCTGISPLENFGGTFELFRSRTKLGAVSGGNEKQMLGLKNGFPK